MKEKDRKNFKLRLLNEENIILIDCDGFEQEIFVPHIKNGRISLQNIIPNRRCCNNITNEIDASTMIMQTDQTSSKSKLKELWNRDRKSQGVGNYSSIRFSFENTDTSNIFQKKGTPVAKSTPVFQNVNRNNAKNAQPASSGKPKITNITILPPLKPFNLFRDSTADISDLQKKTKQNFLHQEKENIPPEFGIITEDYNYEPYINDGRRQTNSKNMNNSTFSNSLKNNYSSPEVARKALNFQNDYQESVINMHFKEAYDTTLPEENQLKMNATKVSNNQKVNRNSLRSQAAQLIKASPVLRKKSLEANISANSMPTTPIISARKLVRRSILNSGDKWRNVKTPIRTYSKLKPLAGSSVKKRKICTPLLKERKILSNAFHNPTQGFRGDGKILFRRRKLILDKPTMITPKSYKHQLTSATPKETKQKDHQLALKNKKLYNVIKKSAFDLLTNSNRSLQMSTKLNKLFQNGCLYKESSTDNICDYLNTVMPMEARDYSNV